MLDAYKCQSCGEVVERPRNCPSCGENAMRPTRVPESELSSADDATDANGGESTDGGEAPADDHTGTSEGTATDGRPERRGRTDADSGGLRSWLRSLF
ncbi:transposase zinc-binding domain-containing protein [Haloarcula sp. S1CR25-12]|uniref:Transposase zinc-binding domain-containing protein n=1 Tax=Haloarcula saliterrae TaxID=2950534 RepID=A0ABU2FB04_9EURY|nr:hypothetical protein [Haloarcula sp. S1CR25-12]MDS0259429.1 transposase zinc-binding domain-containing protein [Haloarcula sp. S1CR25-12]